MSPARAESVAFQILSPDLGGEVHCTLANSGHIVGIINPPTEDEYFHSSGPKPEGGLAGWGKSTKDAGSWWPDWMAWLVERAPERVEVASRAACRSAGLRRENMSEWNAEIFLFLNCA